MADCGHLDFRADDPAVRELGLGAAALAYASMGYAVLPLVRGGKRPSRILGSSGGVHHATTDPGRITFWWRQDRAQNIGVATGTESGIVVVDEDVKEEPNGTITFTALLNDGPREWPGRGVPAAETASGGYHLWLRWPREWGKVPERPRIITSVDVKGDGGYVVVPPSMVLAGGGARPGNPASDPVPVPYRWWSGCPCSVPWAPEWMRDWLRTAPRGGGGSGGHPGSGDREPPDIERLRRDGLRAGERDAECYRAACSLFAAYGTADYGAVESVIREIWQATADKRDFGWDQAVKCLRSAHRWMSQAEAENSGRRAGYAEAIGW